LKSIFFFDGESTIIQGTHKDGILNNSVFENNKVNTSVKNDGVYGGAIYWAGENGIIENTNFTENAAYSYVNESDPKNSTGSRGGAIYFTNANNILIIDSNFIRNFVPRYGNTVGGGAIYFSNSPNARIVNSNFTENHAGASGGAIYIDKNSKGHNITDSSFSKNVADGHDSNQQSGVSGYGGGAIYWMGSDGSIVNTNFTDNRLIRVVQSITLQMLIIRKSVIYLSLITLQRPLLQVFLL